MKQLSDIVELIVNKTHQIIEWRIYDALLEKDKLPEQYYHFDHKKLEEILAMTKPLLSSAQQTRKIEAETSKNIISAITSGKLSIDDATKLMAMTKLKLEVEDKEISINIKKKMIGLLEGE